MSAKTNVEVVIDGKVYTLSGYEGEDYLQKVAAYINNKIGEYNNMEDYRRIPANMKAALIQLNIADDYFKAKAQVEKLEQDLQQKDEEIYDLKHDLIAEQIKLESKDATIKELKSVNQELELNKMHLEAALDESLLGSRNEQITGKSEQSK